MPQIYFSMLLVGLEWTHCYVHYSAKAKVAHEYRFCSLLTPNPPPLPPPPIPLSKDVFKVTPC